MGPGAIARKQRGEKWLDERMYLVILSGIIRYVSEWSKVKIPKGNGFVQAVMHSTKHKEMELMNIIYNIYTGIYNTRVYIFI